jgi:DNA gyrase subunit A
MLEHQFAHETFPAGAMPDQLPLHQVAREIIDTPVTNEMSDSFLAYSLSVITARAIPDVRDGLKPVQRRILYSMQQMGLRPDRPHRKSAHVVGDTMARFHPHGDSAIYETLVRMAQPFARNICFVDPQGNFGSLDDPPAAYRYTECRLSNAALEMLAELDEETVDLRPTYDGETTEPVYLPALLPNLLVNGTTGIAVGMATNMPTHNLREIFAAIELVLTRRRPRPTVDELMALVPGPDFPSGGIVIDESIRDAYETGRGSLRIRARIEVEKLTRTRDALIVTELPYMVGPERVVARIKELLKDAKLNDVADVKNLSDRKHGLKIQIELRGGADPQRTMNELYKQTPLEETFGINNVVLVNGVPTTLGLYDLCQHYITHRLDVIVRRTNFRLRKALERLHIVEGYLIALDAIDLVIRIIRSSQDRAEARTRLMAELTLSEIQANHILDMILARLVALEKLKLEEERDRLVATIADLEGLLASENRQRTLVKNELKELVDAYGADRRSVIVRADEIPVYVPPPDEERALTDEPCIITLSTTGKVGREPASGAKRATPGRDDVIAATTLSSTFRPVFAITSEGRALRLQGADIDDVTGRSRGADVAKKFSANKGENILTIVSPDTESLVLVSQSGLAKRLTAEAVAELRHGRPVFGLKGNDKLAVAFTAPDGVDIVLVTADAQVLRTAVGNISVQGATAGGVAGMNAKGGPVVGGGPIFGDAVVATWTDTGAAKATPADDIPGYGRGSAGVRLTKLADGQRIVGVVVAELDAICAVMGSDDNPKVADPNPVAFPIAPSKRDLVSTMADRPVLALGAARW